jgi:aconitate hydratase
MAPEYGATCGFFGIDEKTLDYLRLTGREEDQIALVEAYAKEQGFWIDPSVEPIFSSTLELDLSTVVPSLAGPKRPQDAVVLPDVDDVFNKDMAEVYKKAQARVPVEGKDPRHRRRRRRDRRDHQLHQHVEPRRADRGRLVAKADEWASSPSPGSRPRWLPARRSSPTTSKRPVSSRTSTTSASTSSVTAAPPASATRVRCRTDQQGDQRKRVVAAPVISGNRNFEGRVARRARELPRRRRWSSPTLKGTVIEDFTTTPIGKSKDGGTSSSRTSGRPTRKSPSWPARSTARCSRPAMPTSSRATSTGRRSTSPVRKPTSGCRFDLRANPPYFDGMTMTPEPVTDIIEAAAADLGDSITTDHISPAGNIKADSPAGKWLMSTRSPRPTSTPTARAVATTKS